MIRIVGATTAPVILDRPIVTIDLMTLLFPAMRFFLNIEDVIAVSDGPLPHYDVYVDTMLHGQPRPPLFVGGISTYSLPSDGGSTTILEVSRHIEQLEREDWDQEYLHVVFIKRCDRLQVSPAVLQIARISLYAEDHTPRLAA